MAFIIDVREPDEFANDHVAEAINVPLSTGMDDPLVDVIPRDAPIIVYCNSGNRSQRAMTILNNKGYSNVLNGINKQSVIDNL